MRLEAFILPKKESPNYYIDPSLWAHRAFITWRVTPYRIRTIPLMSPWKAPQVRFLPKTAITRLYPEQFPSVKASENWKQPYLIYKYSCTIPAPHWGWSGSKDLGENHVQKGPHSILHSYYEKKSSRFPLEKEAYPWYWPWKWIFLHDTV